MITKRHFLQTAACAAAVLAAPRAFAVGNPSYPSRSVKWVVPYAPGGATDVAERAGAVDHVRDAFLHNPVRAALAVADREEPVRVLDGLDAAGDDLQPALSNHLVELLRNLGRNSMAMGVPPRARVTGEPLLLI